MDRLPSLDPLRLLDGLPLALLVVDEGDRLLFANSAAEQLFAQSRRRLLGQALAGLVHPHAPLWDLLRRARAGRRAVAGYGLELALRSGAVQVVDLHLAPVEEDGARLVLLVHPSLSDHDLGRDLFARDAVRPVVGLAALLAHEVKNPLSGIKGAAQLLEPVLEEGDRPLARLISEESDRICRLVEEMERLCDPGVLERQAVNIHVVLDHVRRIAEAGFARHVRFQTLYDPSLPPVFGDRARLVQLFLNLVKNAAEAVPPEEGRIVLSTRFEHGLRIRAGASGDQPELPITVEVADNGPGVPDAVRERLFEPFASTKAEGRGLGLAVAAKIARDHGGLLAYVERPRGALFRVRLPACPEPKSDQEG